MFIEQKPFVSAFHPHLPFTYYLCPKSIEIPSVPVVLLRSCSKIVVLYYYF